MEQMNRHIRGLEAGTVKEKLPGKEVRAPWPKVTSAGGWRKGTGFRANFAPFLSSQEYECLEQENTVLRREIGKLTEELKHLSEALKEHEKVCPLLLCPLNFVPLPRPDPVAGCLPR